MPDNRSSTALRHLAERCTEVRPREFWRALPDDIRGDGIRRGLQNPTGNLRRELQYALLTELRGFRPSVVERWTDTEMLSHARRISKPSDALISEVLIGHFLFGASPVQAEFFDLLGIPHREKQPASLEMPAAPAEHVRVAAHELLQRRAWDTEALAYLLGLALLFADHWPSLAQDLEILAAATVETQAAVAEPSAGGEDNAHEDEESAEDLWREFLSSRTRLSALDHGITRLIIRSIGEGDAAPTRDEIELIVSQFLRINPARTQSLFQLGLLDGLNGKQPADTIPLENDPRRRWYLAGWVTARDRSREVETIAALVAPGGPARKLGDGGEATEVAAPIIAHALFATQRHAEAAKFLSPTALLVCPLSLATSVMDWANELLREDRVQESRRYLELLQEGLTLRAAAGLDVPSDLTSNLRRRLAHCLRLSGNFADSKTMLVSLLADGIPDGYAAMVEADIGLMDGKLDRLSAIGIPRNAEDAENLCRALRCGSERFERAYAYDVTERSHGAYPLGIVALLEGDADTALPLLESAALAFAADADRYAVGELIPKARFFLGLAGLLSDGQEVRTPQFAQMLLEGYQRGYRIPKHLLELVLTSSAIKSPDTAARIVSEMLNAGHDDDIDVIETLDLENVEIVMAKARFRHATRFNKATDETARSVRRCLELAWTGREHDEQLALDALDRLNAMALDGVAVAEFIEVLRNDDLTSGLWGRDERLATIIELLERKGRYAEAASVIGELCHEVLSHAAFGCDEEAAGLLDRIKAYGEPGAVVGQALEGRVQAATQARPSPPASQPHAERYRVSVAIVGGNETQARYQERLQEWAHRADVNIELFFVQSGWTSNWNKHLDDFKRLIPKLDGIVVLRFTRTEFGRAVRRLWPAKPQLGIWGHGEQSLRLAVDAVARQVRERHAAD